MDRRFRKARTLTNWCYIDYLNDGETDRHFKDGDIVEFWDRGKLVRRRVTVHHSTDTCYDHSQIASLAVQTAYVRVGFRPKVRVTEAPAMRFVEAA